MSEDRLPQLEAVLDGLDDLPVEAHPDALEAVQAALVAELDDLAATARSAVGHDAGDGSPRP